LSLYPCTSMCLCLKQEILHLCPIKSEPTTDAPSLHPPFHHAEMGASSPQPLLLYSASTLMDDKKESKKTWTRTKIRYVLTLACFNPFHCRSKGFFGSGNVVARSLKSLQSSLKGNLVTLDLVSGEECSASTCKALIGLQCIPKGASPCSPDAKGNIGRDNEGMFSWT
jgi:hypothetical protein